jgi:dTDP-4-dehydrorhamnose reductase
MKKIILTWAKWMLASDFMKYCSDNFEIVWYDKDSLDITNIENIQKVILEVKPDIVLNCAAYTAVDDAEDIGKLINFQINTLWVYNLAKITAKYNIDFITISTDYVFDGENQNWYDENDICNPINQYWMSKYLWEKLALEENKNSIIIRTSWLYGWWKEFKNFVNTMLKLSETKTELKVVNDQFGLPTFTKDLNFAIWEVIQNIKDFRWEIFHFSNAWEKAINWFDFASEIFSISWKEIKVIPCLSDEFFTKAKRPKYSLMRNNSRVKLRDWREGLRDYLNNL